MHLFFGLRAPSTTWIVGSLVPWMDLRNLFGILFPVDLVPLQRLYFLASCYLVDEWIRIGVCYLFFCLTCGKQTDKAIYISNFYQRIVKWIELHNTWQSWLPLFCLTLGKLGATDSWGCTPSQRASPAVGSPPEVPLLAKRCPMPITC